MVSRKLLVTALAVVCVLSVCITTAFAQPGGRGRGRGGPGGGFGGGFGGGGLTGVLMREDARKELELVDEQVADLQKLAEGQRERMGEMFSGLRDIEDREERFAKMRDLMQKAQAEIEKEVGKILLPHQMKRAKQLAFQLRLRGGAGRALTGGGSLAEELGITESQQEKLRAENEKLQNELRQKIAELQKEAQEELLKILTAEQQAKFKEMVGDPFEFQPMQFGGGPGGPGGGQRGRGRGGR
jgi:Spy/CpxP family protein refolding chaperone